jgi:hypothetical protein
MQPHVSFSAPRRRCISFSTLRQSSKHSFLLQRAFGAVMQPSDAVPLLRQPELPFPLHLSHESVNILRAVAAMRGVDLFSKRCLSTLESTTPSANRRAPDRDLAPEISATRAALPNGQRHENHSQNFSPSHHLVNTTPDVYKHVRLRPRGDPPDRLPGTTIHITA